MNKLSETHAVVSGVNFYETVIVTNLTKYQQILLLFSY